MAKKVNVSDFLRHYEPHAVETNGKASGTPPAAQYGYVMGGNGSVATDAYIKKRAKSSYGDGWEPYYNAYRKWIGHRVFDCNSLAEIFYKEQTGTNIDTKARNNYASWCSDKDASPKDGTLAGLPQLPGVALFSGPSASGITHVGFLFKKSGDGPLDWKVLEARGKDYGVVITDLKARSWEWWGVMDKFFNYDLDADWKPATGPTAAPEAPQSAGRPYNAKCTGGSVYFRTGPGKEHTAIGIARKDEELLALPPAGGWCEAATVIKGKIVRGYISAKYVAENATNTAATRAYPATCGGQGVNLRTGPGTEHRSLGKLDKGAPMIAMPKEAGWCSVAAVLDGKIVVGYMFATYVKSR
ncbi:MAG: Bacterial SH3 domain protein [Firmicutes bacterium ADurb.Bin506]|nr:MAG: Bacterial SH3 domain protein [Firmicutes bacterium ADurb.Bin506]